MRWIDILSASFLSLTRRKLRTALTMLGVVIGSTAIIVTISLGYGAEKTQMEALQSKTNLRLINVRPNSGYYGEEESENSSGRRVTKIDDKVLGQLRRIGHVEALTPVTMAYGPSFIFKIGRLESWTSLVVVDADAIRKILDLKEGTYISKRTDRMEFLLSELAMIWFYDPKKEDNIDYMMIWDMMDRGEDLPVSKSVNWLKDRFSITMEWYDWEDVDETTGEAKRFEKTLKGNQRGIINTSYNDTNMWYFESSAIISTEYYKALMKDNKKMFEENSMPDLSEYGDVLVLVDSVDNVEQVVRDLREIGVTASNTLDTIRELRSQIRTMQMFMGFIGAISMFVAALSIANTMMMSIYERTREIGVMKVLGCKMGNIRLMFLCEAAYIGIFGGSVGVALSFMLSNLLNNAPWLQEIVAQFMPDTGSFSNAANTSVIPFELAGWTFVFVVLVAIGSGFYPAQRAMHLSSLAAIRSD